MTLALTSPVALSPAIRAIGAGAPVTLTAGMAVALPAGAYRIEAARAKTAPVAPALYIGKAYYAAGVVFSGCVRAGMDSPATVTYAEEPGSGKVWVTPANGVAPVAAFDEAQLRGSAAGDATVARSMGITSARDLAFDPAGNLWVAAGGGSSGGLLGYRVETLGMPDRRADARLTPWENARAIAFDAAGNLWAAENVPGGTDRLAMIPAGTLGLGDSSTGMTVTRAAAAAVTLTSAAVDDPFDLAFDAGGNLWVASNALDQVVRFAAPQLVASGAAVAPSVILKARRVTGSTQTDYRGPTSVTFDAAGNLWSGWNAGGTLLRFAAASLAASATLDDPLLLDPMPLGGAGVGADPHAFDVTGGLWLGRTNIGADAALVRVPPAGVAAGGAQATIPDFSSAGLGNGPGSIVLNPSPAGLPIRD